MRFLACRCRRRCDIESYKSVAITCQPDNLRIRLPQDGENVCCRHLSVGSNPAVATDNELHGQSCESNLRNYLESN